MTWMIHKNLTQWLCLFVLSLGVASTPAQARQLVLVFENSLQPSTALDAMARSQMLMCNLAVAEVSQAMFLVQPQRLGDKNAARLQLYSERGHLLVSAGYKPDLLTKPDRYTYQVDLLKAHRSLLPYAGYRQHLHLAYLHEFGDFRIQQALQQFAKARGYRPAFSNYSDWRGVDAYLNQRYQARLKRNRTLAMSELESVYVALMLRAVQEQDALAFNLLGYSPPQTLVLQENDLAAYFIVALVDELRAQGWDIMPARALLDSPIANPLFASGWGANSWWPALTGLADQRVAYPRLIGARQAAVDQLLQQRVPALLDAQ